jgi:hypothetical protein
MAFKPRRLEDLPHFLVAAVQEGETYASGYTDYELSGTFDQTEGVREGRCWLLLPHKNSLIGDLKSFDPGPRTAVYCTAEEDKPPVLGLALPYVDGYWQAYHVWMVLDADHAWSRVIFQPSDALLRRGIDEHGKSWRMLRPAGLIPAELAAEGWGDAELIKGAWDHEHCELCRATIDGGKVAYTDAEDHWVCTNCFEDYVANHDLSFISDF